MTDSIAAPSPSLLRALRELGGRATVGDVVARTGLARDEAKSALKAALTTRRGHVAVSDSGELLYEFDPRLIERDHVSLLSRIGRMSWKLFKLGFKVWTAVMLVAYVVIYVLLILAMIMAASSRDGDSRGFGRRGGFGLGDLLLLHWLTGGPGWRRDRLYYGDRYARRLGGDEKPPFYKKVFAFIFGPDEPKPTQLQKDRSVLQLIRARRGVLTTTELVGHTGLSFLQAEEEMGRLTGAYGGEPFVSPRGEVVYSFPELLRSAHGTVRAREPKPAWGRLRKPRLVTGNDGKSNALIAGLNTFNLAMSVIVCPQLFDMTSVSAAVTWGLIIVPATYSSLFFAIPLCRSVSVRAGNRGRARENARSVLIGYVYSASLRGRSGVSEAEATSHVQSVLGINAPASDVATKELRKLASELDADVEKDDAGYRYDFERLRMVFAEAEAARRALRLEAQKLGRTVYSTRDDSQEAALRDQKIFDALLQSGRQLSRYAPSADDVDYEEDFDLVLSDARDDVENAERPSARWRD